VNRVSYGDDYEVESIEYCDDVGRYPKPVNLTELGSALDASSARMIRIDHRAGRSRAAKESAPLGRASADFVGAFANPTLHGFRAGPMSFSAAEPP
jgi:hypothetical protein